MNTAEFIKSLMNPDNGDRCETDKNGGLTFKFYVEKDDLSPFLTLKLDNKESKCVGYTQYKKGDLFCMGFLNPDFNQNVRDIVCSLVSYSIS